MGNVDEKPTGRSKYRSKIDNKARGFLTRVERVCFMYRRFLAACFRPGSIDYG